VHESSGGAWLPIAEAAERLGVAVHELRGQAREVPSRDGSSSTWMVWLTSVQMASTAADGAEPDAELLTPEDAETIRIRLDLFYTQDLNRMLTAQIAELRSQLKEAHEQIRALRAREEALLQSQPPEPPRWQFWRRPASHAPDAAREEEQPSAPLEQWRRER
jgi:hypothetical protein